MPAEARTETWLDSVEHQLYCTRLASPDERASLEITFGKHNNRDYWTSPSRDPVDRVEKYLLVIGAIAYQADSSNDQDLRQRAVFHAIATAVREKTTHPLSMRQLYLCAHAVLISSNLETDNPQAVGAIADMLVREYRAMPPGPAVQDLPLVNAIREVSLRPDSEVARKMAELARSRAEVFKITDPGRASRLLSAAALGLGSYGDAEQALALARASTALLASQKGAGGSHAAWANFPVLQDSLAALQGRAAAADLATSMLSRHGPPPESDDEVVQFHIYSRLARRAQEALLKGDQSAGDWYTKTMLRAHQAANQDHHSLPFLRAALATLEQDRSGSASEDFVWRHDRSVAARDYRETYRPMLDVFVRQMLALPIGDVRTRLIQQAKIERWMDTLGRLAVTLPADRPEIADLAFRGLQLHSWSSVSAGTMKGFVRRWRGDPKTRENILRFLTMQADSSLSARRTFAKVYQVGYGGPAADAVLADAAVTLNFGYQEMNESIARNRKFIATRAPDLAVLVLGWPGSISDAQALLKDDEALVALLPTDSSLLVLSITKRSASLARSELTRTELSQLVRRLRESLLPIDMRPGIEVKPFDAAAAFELYRLTVGRISGEIEQKRHLFWYSGPELASIPSAVLIDRPPPREMIADPAELAELSWFADRHAVSVLPEPYLFWMFRGTHEPPAQTHAFIGIGAPQLSLLGLQRPQEARSMALAGGLDGIALANLPKLPEAADELRGLAALLGEDKSVLLLGPEATKANVAAVLARGGDVISFATHGFVANEISGISDPSLLLATEKSSANALQSLLTTGEIAALDLESRLIILSACNTATSDGRPRGASFTGLSQSFTSAGARALLVSHWPVASMAAADLSVQTVSAARDQEQELAFALRASMMRFRINFPEYTHPFYWAPFVFVGDGRKNLQ